VGGCVGGVLFEGGRERGAVLTHAPVVLLGAEEPVEEEDRGSIGGGGFGGWVEVVGEGYAVAEGGGGVESEGGGGGLV